MKSSATQPLNRWSQTRRQTRVFNAKVKAERWWYGETGQWAAFAFCFFMIMFPKGGFKVGPVPITWGYILISLLAVAALPKALLHPNLLRPKRAVVLFFALMIPYQLLLLLEFGTGIDEVGFAISISTSFFILPVVFLLLWRSWYSEHTLVALLRIMRVCILITALYGIFLFFYKVLTGHLIEIPYLTVNAADAGLLETTKAIDRGGVFKLISTYNNGNVYGVATLILLPLYDRVETSKTFKLLLRVALLLTLSRTVWAGILCERALSSASLLLTWSRQFPKIKRQVFRRSAGNLILLLSIFGGILLVTAYGSSTGRNFTKNFLTDTSLGGRTGNGADNQIPALSDIHLIHVERFGVIREMVFFSTLSNMGLIGFASLLLLFLAPIFIAIQDRNVFQNPIRRAALKGMLVYFAVAWVDGALEYIPVMAFYWLAAIFLIYWPPKLSIPTSQLSV